MEQFETELTNAMRAMRGHAARILRHHPADVDDVMQNAAIKAWRFRESFRGEAHFNTYFFRIVVNEALMHLRKESATPQAGHTELLDVEDEEKARELEAKVATPERAAYAAEIREAIARAVAQMPTLRRQEAKLFLLGDCASREGARKARRFRARQDLKRALTERGICATFA